MAALLTASASVRTVPADESSEAQAVTPQEMKRIRKELGLSHLQLGRACGHLGENETVNRTMRRYEALEEGEIPPVMGRLLTMFDRYGVPEDFLGGKAENG